MERILVIRLSAMGDVAMTVPVISQLLAAYPALEIDMLTRPSFQPIFPPHDRLHFIDIDLKAKHKGFLGLLRLFRSLKNNNYVAVADLHDVLRSQVVRTLFKLTGTRNSHIDKGRKGKAALTRKTNKEFIQLKTTNQRYADVFSKLGYPIDLAQEQLQHKANNNIGIAPFAAHREKMWPIEKTKLLIDRLLNDTDAELYLFGGGVNESSLLNEIAATSNRIISTADMTLARQMDFMSNLSVLVSMDSANMHLASNLHIPVVSIWGATHSYAGFLGYNQSIKNCVQRDDLDCRPCSVFGNKTCWRGDWACMDIDVGEVYERIMHSRV